MVGVLVTGITKARYMAAVKGEGSLSFMCADCQERTSRSVLHADCAEDNDGEDGEDDVCFYVISCFLTVLL